MPRQPEQFWRGEAGHGNNPGNLCELRHCPLKNFAFGGRPTVVPQDRGADRYAMMVNKNRAMHLSRKPEGADVFESGRLCCAQVGQSLPESGPPVLGILLRPPRTRCF